MAEISSDTSFSFDGDPFSPRVIIITQYKRCLASGCVEFKGGYWQTKVIKSENGIHLTEKVYISDTREIYCNTIMQLYNCAFPHFDYDDEETEDVKKRVSDKCLKIIEDIEQLEQNAVEKTSSDDSAILSSEFYTSEEDKWVLENYKVLNLRLHVKMLRVLSRWLKDEDYLDRDTAMVDG
jgi:hypothetical protein